MNCTHSNKTVEYKPWRDEEVCQCGARRRLFGLDQEWRRVGEGWRTAEVTELDTPKGQGIAMRMLKEWDIET
jgi:hypothetical protein